MFQHFMQADPVGMMFFVPLASVVSAHSTPWALLLVPQAEHWQAVGALALFAAGSPSAERADVGMILQYG
eukprot:1489073-Pyramimonas_sp.AAC.1